MSNERKVPIENRASTGRRRRPRASGVVVLIGALSVLGLTGCASMTRSQKAATACVAADLATTAWGLSEGLDERNPVFSHMEAWQLVATNAAIHWGLSKLSRKVERRKAARFWSSYAAIRCGAALHNVDLIERGGQDSGSPPLAATPR